MAEKLYQINGREFARHIEEGVTDKSARNLRGCALKPGSKIDRRTIDKLNGCLTALDPKDLMANPYNFEHATMEWFGFGSTGTNLYLPYSIFRNTNLENANFERSVFDYCDFTGATLKGAYLKSTSFIKSILRQTNLRRTNMIVAKLGGADLESADFYAALLAGTAFCNPEGYDDPGYQPNLAKNLDKTLNLDYASRDNVILHPDQVEIWMRKTARSEKNRIQVLGYSYSELVEVP